MVTDKSYKPPTVSQVLDYITCRLDNSWTTRLAEMFGKFRVIVTLNVIFKNSLLVSWPLTSLWNVQSVRFSWGYQSAIWLTASCFVGELSSTLGFMCDLNVSYFKIDRIMCSRSDHWLDINMLVSLNRDMNIALSLIYETNLAWLFSLTR